MDRKLDVVLFMARLGVGAVFLVSGILKLLAWGATAAFAESKGVPTLLMPGATAVELLGAMSLLTGWKVRWGAAGLCAFLVPVTLVFHRFWDYPPAEVSNQMVQFLKNIGIGGGLLAIFAAGSGELSVDARRFCAAAAHSTSELYRHGERS